MVTKPKTGKASAAARRKANVVPFPKTIDPIFALIAAHKRTRQGRVSSEKSARESAAVADYMETPVSMGSTMPARSL
jgi:hypothetical protein